jgi:hypothetical protein
LPLARPVISVTVAVVAEPPLLEATSGVPPLPSKT